MKITKSVTRIVIVLGITLAATHAAFSKPPDEIFTRGSGDVQMRSDYLEGIKILWEDNGEILREPSPKLLSWYDREKEFQQDWTKKDKKTRSERVQSFERSTGHAHVELFYALKRIDRIVDRIPISMEKGHERSELFLWIALSAEVNNCSDLIWYAKKLEQSNEISKEDQKSISNFCSFVQLRLHRTIIMPFYQNIYFDN